MIIPILRNKWKSLNMCNDGIPEVVYKYRSWQESEKIPIDEKYQRRILTHSEIYFTNPKKFNDPFDSTIPKRYDKLSEIQQWEMVVFHLKINNPSDSETDIYGKAKEIIAHGHLNDNEYLKKGEKKDIEAFCNNHGVFSASMKPDNILMWSHYGNSHRGFCIGFDAVGLVKSLENQKRFRDWYFSLFNVNYSNNYPIVIPTIDEGENFKNLLKRILTKAKLWKYENEYRYVLTGASSKAIVADSHLFKEIIFGCNIDPDVKRQIKAILSARFPHIKCFQAERHKTRFQLDIISEK